MKAQSGPESHMAGFLPTPQCTDRHEIMPRSRHSSLQSNAHMQNHTASAVRHCLYLCVHLHASADVITVSAASVAQRCETKSCSPPSIIKSFLAIGQLTLASRTVPFHFPQSHHLYCKRGKDCQMISACFHHRQRLIMWNLERRLKTLIYCVRFFCEVSQPCWQQQAVVVSQGCFT